MISSDNDAAIT